MRHARHFSLAVLAGCAFARAGAAQPVGPQAARDSVCTMPAAIAPVDPESQWFTVRGTDRPLACDGRNAVRMIGPTLHLTHRSGIPDLREVGVGLPLAGWAAHLRAGIEYRLGPLHLRMTPEAAIAQNRDFFTFTSAEQYYPGFNAPGDPSRSDFSSPWYFGAVSADLPSRPGNELLARIHPGESGVWILLKHLRLGGTTSLPSWGPDVGESLVLGRSAPGIPRLEAVATLPSVAGQTVIGWFSGIALESRFFDRDSTNDVRGIAGVRFAHAAGALHLGASRTVMDGRRGAGVLPASSLPFTRSAFGDTLIDMLSVDVRLDTPDTDGSLWAEATRQTPLRSGQDLLRLPTEGIALRFGFQQRVTRTARAEWRVASEVVRLDQPAQRTGRHPADFYTSAAVPHGWTHLGHPLGSGLGPGGQRQLLSVERRSSRLSLRAFGERIRWNDDALYRQFLPNWYRHDVTYQFGLRAAGTLLGTESALSIRWGRRTNYLFQNDFYIPGYRLSDVTQWHLGLTMAPGQRAAVPRQARRD